MAKILPPQIVNSGTRVVKVECSFLVLTFLFHTMNQNSSLRVLQGVEGRGLPKVAFCLRLKPKLKVQKSFGLRLKTKAKAEGFK